MARPRARTLSQTALIPAASRAPETLTEVEAALNGQAIETFTRAVGGRDQLADILAVASSSPDIEKIALYLADPRYREVSLRRICGYVGITVADLFAAYRKALITRAQIEATHIIAAKIPPVVEDVMTRAAPTPVACDVCKGLGQLATATETTPCWRCAGTGRVASEPDLDRQKLALELAQLTEKKGGILMQQNTIAAAALGSTAPGSLEQLQQAVGDLLFGNRRHADFQEGEQVRDTPPSELPDDAEVEGDLPFGDPREPPRPRHPDDPGEPEPS